MITTLYDLTIHYDENNGEWTIVCWGTDEDAPVTIEDKAACMLDHHDEISRHVDKLCREIAAESQDCADYCKALDAIDYRRGL